MYQILRNEQSQDSDGNIEFFIQVSVNISGFDPFTFARWLTVAQAVAYSEDSSVLDSIILNWIEFEKLNIHKTSVITKLKFMNRFTQQEQFMLVNYKDTIGMVKDLTPETIQERIMTMNVIMMNFNMAQDIDLTDPQTIQIANVFALYGFIAPERVEEILTI